MMCPPRTLPPAESNDLGRPRGCREALAGDERSASLPASPASSLRLDVAPSGTGHSGGQGDSVPLEVSDSLDASIRPRSEVPLQLETTGVTSHLTPRAQGLRQGELWHRGVIHAAAVAAKLHEAGLHEEASKLDTCHSTFTVATCLRCGKQQRFPNRCDLFFCPMCQPRLAHLRAESVGWWCDTISQPKHVVLTLTNTETLEREHIDFLHASLRRLRNRKFTASWRGGLGSIEVTNEGRGWHLHLHLLVDARWIDAGQLACEWDSCTRGRGHIVKVRDCRKADYLREVVKYAVKGSQLASWSPADVAAFVKALDGKRTFFVFGSLYGKRTEWREWIDAVSQHGLVCECGSSDFKFESEAEAEWSSHYTPAAAARPPPAKPEPQTEFAQFAPAVFSH